MGFVQDGGHSIEDGLEALLDTGDDGEGGGIGHFVFGILKSGDWIGVWGVQ